MCKRRIFIPKTTLIVLVHSFIQSTSTPNILSSKPTLTNLSSLFCSNFNFHFATKTNKWHFDSGSNPALKHRKTPCHCFCKASILPNRRGHLLYNAYYRKTIYNSKCNETLTWKYRKRYNVTSCRRDFMWKIPN